MKKFMKDLLEVGKDIKCGVYFVFECIVLFFWSAGVILNEHGGNLIKHINRYRKLCSKNDSIVITPATAEVMNNVVREG